LRIPTSAPIYDATPLGPEPVVDASAALIAAASRVVLLYARSQAAMVPE